MPGDVDVAYACGYGNFPLGGGRADDEVIDQDTAVSRASLERVEMKHVSLHALAQGLDSEIDLPQAVTQPECLLQTGGFLWEKSDRDLSHTVGFPSDQSEASRRDSPEITTPRFHTREAECLEFPRACFRSFVLFQSHADELSVHHRLFKNDLEAAFPVLHLAGHRVVCHLHTRDGRYRMVRRNL